MRQGRSASSANDAARRKRHLIRAALLGGRLIHAALLGTVRVSLLEIGLIRAALLEVRLIHAALLGQVRVTLLEVRLAMALGGKAFCTLTGDVSSVQAAVAAGRAVIAEAGVLVNAVVIARPHPDVYREVI